MTDSMMSTKPKNIYYTWSPQTIKRLVAGLRQNGPRRRKRTVVFTNGVFDILHYGHVDYLTKARKLGDVLIVGLNSDSSVKKFKAAGRPIQPEKDRARILAALRPVDIVVMFKEETPERLIRAVAPDVLVKGADYKLSEIVGADFVQSYGGKVRRIKLQPSRSTTAILKRL